MSVSKSVRFPEDLVAAIEKAAGEQDRSFSYLVARACAERFLFKANPYSVADRPRRASEVETFEEALSGGEESGLLASGPVADSSLAGGRRGPGQAASPRVPQVPGVVRVSSLAKVGVKPIPKGKS